MQSGRIRRHALSAAVAIAATVSVAAGANTRSRLIIGPQAAFAMRVVAAHNQLRAGVSVHPVTWDAELAASADAYAAELARSGKFAHSHASSRHGQGENLWRGTRGAFSIERMVADWGSEKRMFRAGRFPQVSTTGRWEDVGHYTQIIWPTTLRVGCAARPSAQHEYLVCRYARGGNVFGQRVGTPVLAAR